MKAGPCGSEQCWWPWASAAFWMRRESWTPRQTIGQWWPLAIVGWPLVEMAAARRITLGGVDLRRRRRDAARGRAGLGR